MKDNDNSEPLQKKRRYEIDNAEQWDFSETSSGL